MNKETSNMTRKKKVRKAVVTVTNAKDGINVSIQFFPAAEMVDPGLCGHLGVKGFMAITEEIYRLNEEEGKA